MHVGGKFRIDAIVEDNAAVIQRGVFWLCAGKIDVQVEGHLIVPFRMSSSIDWSSHVSQPPELERG